MRHFVLALAIIFATPVIAADYVGASARYTQDTESSAVYELRAVRGKTFSDGQYLEFGLGDTIFREKGNSDIDYAFIDASGRYNINEKTYMTGSVRVHSGYNDTPLSYDITVMHEEDRYVLGLFTERSMVDSHAAIGEDLFSTIYGGTIDYNVTDQVTLTAVLFQQNITDGNKKYGEMIQVSYSPKQIEGLYVKLKGSFKQADNNPVEYFAPDEYIRYDAIIGYVRVFGNDNWKFRGELGPANQYIDSNKESAWSYKIEVSGWITQQWRLELMTAAIHDNGDYSYQYEWTTATILYYW